MTRKYFGTDGIRGRVGQSLLNPEFAVKLGWAAATVLNNLLTNKSAKHPTILVGKDTRISGYLFESAIEAGIAAAGVDVQLLGPMPTPAIAYLTRTLRATAGIVISASHNPYYDNGIKFFSGDGTKLPDSVEIAIEQQMEQLLTTVDSAHLGKAFRVNDAPGRYIEFCKSTIPSAIRLNSMKIVLDCANGATYHIAPNVFEELGAEVISLAIEPDGFNINENCGATRPEILQKIVKAEQADLGIAFDGDGDRVIMVDHTGEVVDGDELLFIIAREQAKIGRLHGGVVGTVMSNLGLEQSLNILGIAFKRASVGDRYVMEELVNSGWQLGGESSGHVICLDKTTTGDGIVAALQVLVAIHNTGLSLHELKLGMEKLPQIKINVKTLNGKAAVNHPQVQKMLKSVEKQLHGCGRVLLRPSGTEPVTRVMVEGEDQIRMNEFAQQLAAVVKDVAEENNKNEY